MKRAMVERVDPAGRGFGVLIDDQVHARFRRHPVTQLVHFLELPGGVDMQQRERRGRGVERQPGQVQHHRAVLANRIHHHRALSLCHHFAHDVDRFGLKPLKMGQATDHYGPFATGR